MRGFTRTSKVYGSPCKKFKTSMQNLTRVVLHNHINHSIHRLNSYIPTVHFLNDMVFRYSRDRTVLIVLAMYTGGSTPILFIDLLFSLL